jgi:hypothetical protein
MKFSRWYIDIFFSGHVVVLMNFQVASLTIEVPARALLERRDDHRLRWIKLNQLAIEINPGRTKDSMFIHSKEVCIRNNTAPVHFEFEKLLPIDIFCSRDAIQHRELNFPTSVRFYIWDTKRFSQFFCHVVLPSHPGCGGNKRGSPRGCRQKYGSKEDVPQRRARCQSGSDRSHPTNLGERIRLLLTTASA